MSHTIEISIRIQFQGRWHVGSGGGKGLVERAVLLNGKKEPYIPGSTLKGVTRQCCEDLAETLGLEVADPHDLTNIATFESLQKNHYIVERLFGSRYEGECLFFRDASLPLGGKFFPSLHLLPITRTKIDRLTGCAAEDHLFSTEYGEPLILEGSILGYHPLLTFPESKRFPLEYLLLIAGIGNLSRLGADKSIGKGMLEVEILEIKWNGNKVLQAAALSDFRELEIYEIYREGEING